MSNNIYIYYEFFKREFLSNLLLSVVGAKKDLNIYIGTNKVFNTLHEKKLISPGIFHTKSLSHGANKTNFHKKLVKDKFMITSIDQEHGVIDKGNFNDLFIKPRVYPDDLNLCSAYFCWGSFDYKNLSEKFRSKKIFYLTGSPRVDLWKKDFDKIWKNKKTKKEKYILFVSNFSFCNNYYSYKQIIDRKREENYYIRSPILEKEEKKYYQYQKKTMKKFMEFIKKFSKKFPDKIMYIRPHPTERLDYWVKNLKNYKNIYIKDDGDISAYIRNAECIIQNGCTSAMESYISNVPVINYVPINSKNQIFGEFIKKISQNVYNEKRLLNLINKKNYKILDKKKYLVNKRMLFLDKNFSSNKIIKTWKKLLKRNSHYAKNKSNLKNKNYKIFLYLFFYDLYMKLTTNLVLFLKGKLYLKKIIYHKNEKINVPSIKHKIEEITKSLNIKNNLSVTQLGQDILYISLKKK